MTRTRIYTWWSRKKKLNLKEVTALDGFSPCPSLRYFSDWPVERINWSTFSVSKVQIVMLWSQKQRLQTIPGSPGACWSGLYASFAWDVCAYGSVSRADLVTWALLDHRPDLLQPQLLHPRQGHHLPLQSKARLTKNIHRVSMKSKMPSCYFFLLCVAKWFIKFNDFSVIITIITFIRNISVIPMMSSSRVNNHTCVSMRYGSIRLIISVGRGLCRCFVSNIQIYGCLKKKRVHSIPL